MKTRDVVFYSEGAKMAGTIYLPDDYKEGEKRAAVLCNSGWTGVNKCYPALYARALTAYGFVCMGFDYRGFKPSEDVHPCLPKYTTLETEVEDIANAFTFMQVQPEVDPERCGLLGWGVGGAVCITVAARDKEVKAVATLNSFINGERWMRDGMGNDAFGKSVARLRQDHIKRITTNDPVLMHPYTDYPNITESGDFYTDHVLKEINGGIQSSVDADSGEEFPTPMSTAIGESFIRFNVEDLLPKIAPRAVFVGHGYYNELHQRVEAEEAYRLANEPKQLYYVDGKHNEWMFDEDPKFQALAAALADFYKEHLKPMEFGLQK